MKKEFLHDEFWLLTIGAAFQHANVYIPNVPEKEKKAFRNKLHAYVKSLLPEYSETVSQEEHIRNIWSISRYTEKNYPEILSNGKINFGISQKILNLYLKYLWCIDEIKTPPHFPVDRIIQKKLDMRKIYSWTQIQDEKPYIEIINHAFSVLKTTSYDSLAELELNHYKRN